MKKFQVLTVLLMLVLLLAACNTAGNNTAADNNEPVEQVDNNAMNNDEPVEEPADNNAAVEEPADDDLKDAIKDFNKQTSKDIKQLNEIVGDYESTPEAFNQLFTDAFAKRKQEVETLWQRRSDMLAHIKADEWQTIINSAKAEAAEDKK